MSQLPVGDPVPDWRSPPPPFREPMAGRCCHLEPVDVAAHAESLFAAYAEDAAGEMWTYMLHGPFSDVDAYRRFIVDDCLADDPMFFAVIVDGRALGVAAYLRINPPAGSIEVGHIAYSPSLQRTTAATEAMYLMMRHAFDLGYRRYEWKCDARNAASRRAADRLGFTYEGTHRQALVYKGRNRDTAWYSILDSEWPRVRDALEAWLAPDNFDEDGTQGSRLET